MLDLGCGPGTITADLAARVAPGAVIGIEPTPGPLADARAHAAAVGAENVTFAVGDAYALDYPDGAFDVVHAHQVLQHLGDPVAALREMLRVCEPDGIVPSAGVWCYATPEDRAWWAGLWADRSVASNFAAQAIAHGLADEVGLELLADAWREWGKQPDGWFAVLHGEVLARA